MAVGSSIASTKAIVLARLPQTCVLAKVVPKETPVHTKREEETAIASLLGLSTNNSPTEPSALHPELQRDAIESPRLHTLVKPEPVIPPMPALVKATLLPTPVKATRSPKPCYMNPMQQQTPQAHALSFEAVCSLTQDALPNELHRFTQIVSAICQNQSPVMVAKILHCFFEGVFGFRLSGYTLAPSVIEEVTCCPYPAVIGKLVSHVVLQKCKQGPFPEANFIVPWQHAYRYCINFNLWLQKLNIQGHSSAIPCWFEPFQLTSSLA